MKTPECMSIMPSELLWSKAAGKHTKKQLFVCLFCLYYLFTCLCLLINMIILITKQYLYEYRKYMLFLYHCKPCFCVIKY